MNEIILISIISLAAIYFIYSAKQRDKSKRYSHVKHINAEKFINGMSEMEENDFYAGRTFKKGFTVAKAKSGEYIFIKQAKLVDTGLAY